MCARTIGRTQCPARMNLGHEPEVLREISRAETMKTATEFRFPSRNVGIYSEIFTELLCVFVVGVAQTTTAVHTTSKQTVSSTSPSA